MKPVACVFLTAYACNLRCDFCLNAWRNTKTPDDLLSCEQQLRVIDILAANGIKLITFSGGEPLSNPHCADLICYAKAKGLKTFLQTNGTLITPEFLSKVKGKLDSIQVSIEGTEREHNELTKGESFQRAIRGIKLAKASGFRVMTNFTITTKNLHCIEQHLALLDTLGVDVANFTRLYAAGNALEHPCLMPSAEQYALFLRRLAAAKDLRHTKVHIQGPTPQCFIDELNIPLANSYCGAGKDELAVNPNGDVLPCPAMNTPVGNILNDRWDELMQRIESITDRASAPDGCHACPAFTQCGSGCLLNRVRGADPLMVRRAGIVSTSISLPSPIAA
ncbi:radical SAM protein [Candidatus Woesearchaeota archaeon]|nr:radical SAM protein [Candidatus Woesearchaeota archaeon]